MKIINIPSLTDNYIWILYNNKQCIIVDPGEYKPVLQTLNNLNLTPRAIFLTHHHKDHVSGVFKLLKYYNIPVYGPSETKDYGTNIFLNDKHTIKILNLKFEIIPLPGHTLQHIGYYHHPWLFCGDTVFSAGCGKISKGTEKIMYQSLQKIKKLNKKTLICSGHEYTLSNIKFSISILPQDKNLISYKNYIENKLKNNKSTLPSLLENELKINLFFRCHETIIKNKLKCHIQEKEWKVFAKLRKKKDDFSKK